MRQHIHKLTATNVISGLTAAAWLITAATGQDEAAALALGFIPARLSGAAVQWAAIPAWLTPLSSTLVHSGLFHLFFNLLMLVWCGRAVERVIGAPSLILIHC